ncbi:unnamed protein product [Arabis nemorensis]|uniref:non-specific serine/threonine protein kinase n=1 Tax=Arabis nemorensis TaxID=586526 RepID=A0A565ATX3_9BRAS|nr:unnamed protein product [Arabis nemorensis]
MDYRGLVIWREWIEARRNWMVGLQVPATDCDLYRRCGQFATCNPRRNPLCSCIRGFRPRDLIEWNSGNWSGGCIRRVSLQCNNGNADGFLRLSRMNLPEFAIRSEASAPECLRTCLKTCSCIACAHGLGGCMIWNGSLIGSQEFTVGGVDLYIRLAHSEFKTPNKRPLVIGTLCAGGIFVVAACGLLARWIVMKKRGTDAEQILERVEALAGGNKEKLKELPLFEFQVLVAATDNFSLRNKLGQGGFGPVYKGKLKQGQEIAVKRLSRASGQGLEELVNEVVVISKLQHRNLVKLLGWCIAGVERMLVYEFMPKNSLDFYLFDPAKAKLLDWKTRFNIINGICRGLLYLHRDSRLRIIHRDLKASNILLDENLIPKISDFGLARIFLGNEDEENTRRVVGTYGYMSPEYAMGGVFSEKSDVFSLGVILLEIVSGRRNSNSTLLAYVWSIWNEGEIDSLVDPEIFDKIFEKEIRKCVHIGLLCVQEAANDRPIVATVCSMLSSEIADIPEPKQPAFIPRNVVSEAESSENSDLKASINNVCITNVTGRFQKPLFERYIHATGASCFSARNYYDVLGVSPKATREEIKKSFHELAKKFHPDTNRNNPSAKKKFQEIREAYETLSNSERREEYDKLRYRNSDYVNNDGGDAERFRRAYQSNFSDSFHKIFSEIFEDETDQIASDIRVELSLSFSEAAEGCTKRLSFDAYVFCDSCDGLGHALDAAIRACPTCRGIGRITIPPFTTICQTCKGSGHIVKEFCISCRGSGVVEATKTVEIGIPGGVESEAMIKIEGAGNVRSRKSLPGNLYIKLKVANDSTFSRDGSDIYVDANISFTQAILGGKVEVPTLSGKIQLDIPKGTQPGQLLVLRGKGLPKRGFFVDQGDQYVRFRVNFPTEINERQRAILEEFAKEEINSELSGSSEESWNEKALYWLNLQVESNESSAHTRFLITGAADDIVEQVNGMKSPRAMKAEKHSGEEDSRRLIHLFVGKNKQFNSITEES